MRKIFLIMVVFTFSVTACVAEDVKIEETEKIEERLLWLENFEEAQEIAKIEDKTILVDFTGSDWCGWCIKLDNEVFSQTAFIDYANANLVLVKLDFPRKVSQTEEKKKYNRALAQKYGIKGFPTILLFDASGEVIAKTGYQQGGPESYVLHLEEFIHPKQQ